ncbi:MAG: hypothetical protein HY319_08250 [Armatimonadetes bacterium]|nr:hypothetical protein [Armatimonadota bacterium]
MRLSEPGVPANLSAALENEIKRTTGTLTLADLAGGELALNHLEQAAAALHRAARNGDADLRAAAQHLQQCASILRKGR